MWKGERSNLSAFLARKSQQCSGRPFLFCVKLMMEGPSPAAVSESGTTLRLTPRLHAAQNDSRVEDSPGFEMIDTSQEDPVPEEGPSDAFTPHEPIPVPSDTLDSIQGEGQLLRQIVGILQHSHAVHLQIVRELKCLNHVLTRESRSRSPARR